MPQTGSFSWNEASVDAGLDTFDEQQPPAAAEVGAANALGWPHPQPPAGAFAAGALSVTGEWACDEQQDAPAASAW
jgi:hypothetical protein